MTWTLACALGASGCSYNRHRAAVLSTTRSSEVCGAVVMRGELAPASPTGVRVELVGEITCGAATRTVYRVDRWAKLNAGGITAVTLGTGLAFGLGAVGIIAASSQGRSIGSQTTDRGVYEVAGLASFGVGLGLGYLLSDVLRAELSPKTEVEETPGVPEVRAFAVAGPLESAHGGRQWPLLDGGVTLEFAALSPLDLELARANGFTVEWSSTAVARLSLLAACHGALEGSTPGAAPDCRRFDAALRCAEGGWAVAEPVRASLVEACAGLAPALDAGVPLSPTAPPSSR